MANLGNPGIWANGSFISVHLVNDWPWLIIAVLLYKENASGAHLSEGNDGSSSQGVQTCQNC